MTPRKFLTPKEAAPYLGGRANARTVLLLIRRGELKGKRIGREWRILPEWLEEYMSQPEQSAPSQEE
ncbi:MAG: helix-turn-helix domain-containing protein [Candidatus Limiplasma sp.]|nr:helix-turn-helix domain-containing protein [Candidatus Limiplasma sp.]